MSIVTVYAVLRQNGDVLMQKRQNTGFGDGQYSFVGGHVEDGENIRQAVIREAREEIGILIPDHALSLVLVLHRKTPNGVFLNFFFEATAWENPIRICEPDKASDLAFFNASNLPPNTLDYIRHAISCIGRRVHDDTLGWGSLT